VEPGISQTTVLALQRLKHLKRFNFSGGNVKGLGQAGQKGASSENRNQSGSMENAPSGVSVTSPAIRLDQCHQPLDPAALTYTSGTPCNRKRFNNLSAPSKWSRRGRKTPPICPRVGRGPYPHVLEILKHVT